MRAARTQGAIWLMLACCTLSVQASPLAPQDDDESLYREALTDLDGRRTQSAIDKLTRLVERNPSHLGALLDLAISHCQANKPDDAEVLFQRLQQLDNLPPAIGELINYYRSGNCQPSVAPWRKFVAVGMGYANNLNFAPSNQYFFLGPLGLTVQLADSARPRRDSFRTIEAGISRQATENNLGMGFLFQGFDYRQSNDYDTNLSHFHVNYKAHLGSARTEALGIYSHLTLGGKAYLDAWSGQVSALWPTTASESLQAGPVLTLSDLNYLPLPDYRSRITEIKIRGQWQPTPSFRLISEVGTSQDKALAERPGGSRQGPIFQFNSQWILNDQHSLELLYRQSWQKDRLPYSPAFFGETKRQPTTTSWLATWRYQLPEQLTLRLEARHGTNRDSIELFDYRSSSLTLFLEWHSR